MEQAAGLVTVYRSMDETAKDDCETIVQLLTDDGISATMLDDDSPGVLNGCFEVQVAQQNAARAEELIAANPLPDDVKDVNDASELDMETIFHSEGSTTAEFEAMSVKSVLESNGLSAMIVGDSVLPNFPFEVRVAREHADRARELMAEALRSGPAAADEAELESERGVTELPR